MFKLPAFLLGVISLIAFYLSPLAGAGTGLSDVKSDIYKCAVERASFRLWTLGKDGPGVEDIVQLVSLTKLVQEEVRIGIGGCGRGTLNDTQARQIVLGLGIVYLGADNQIVGVFRNLTDDKFNKIVSTMGISL